MDEPARLKICGYTADTARPADTMPERQLEIPSPAEPVLRIARYALSSGPRPPVTRSLPTAESARSALMSIYGQMFISSAGVPAKSTLFSGKDASGTLLRGHGHAYFLPTDEDNDGYLDCLTVYCAAGFDAGHVASLHALRWIQGSGRSQSLLLSMVAIAADGQLGKGPTRLADSWVSATPYIATRFSGRHELRSPHGAHALLAEDLRRQFAISTPDPAVSECSIHPVCSNADGGFIHPLNPSLRPVSFVRGRNKSADDGPHRLAGFFRLKFAHPVAGPLCFGHSSHFGMGLFLPDPLASGHPIPNANHPQ